MAKIWINPITIKLEGTLHLGAGYRRGLIDNAIARDGNGRVYVPGSSFKGKVREACEWIASSQGLCICQAPNPNMMCGGSESHCKHQPCIICRVFGGPGGHQQEILGLYWDNAYLPQLPDVEKTNRKRSLKKGQLKLSYPRTQVGMSRSRGVAYEGLLYTGEFTAEGLAFQTCLSGYLELTPVLGEKGRYYELILLVAGLRLVDSLGGNTSRGAGRCHINLPDYITVNSVDFGEEDLSIDWLLERLELLQLYKEEIEEVDG